MVFGQGLDKDLEAAESQGKRKKPLSESEKRSKRDEVFRRWLGDEAPARQFRDPAKQRG